MPSSSGKMWFITVSPVQYADIDEKRVESLSILNYQYHVILERGITGSHPHIHAFISMIAEDKQENVRNRWKRVLPKEYNFRVALKVVKVTDKDRLIGEYLQKESDHVVLHSNLESGYLAEIKDHYKVVNDKRKLYNNKNGKVVPLNSLPNEIITYAKANEMDLKTRGEFRLVLCSMCRNGYNFVSTLNRMKYVWAQIQMMSDQEPDFDFLF